MNTHKSGFVSIVGNPNVGKSTLMNQLLGERLSIVTSKAQTTRHRIFGILDEPNYQIVFSDTPGVLAPKYELQRAMRKTIESTLEDSDLLLYITDVIENPEKHADFLQRARQSQIPIILTINKIDLTDQEKLHTLVAQWEERLPQSAIIPISALHQFGIAQIHTKILELLPEGPKYYPPDTLTDRPIRFFITEIIREKILLLCRDEVPYSVEVAIRDYHETPTRDHIHALIFVERDSQKGILIGAKGHMLKRIGTQARRDMQTFLQKPVHLQLTVQVRDQWRHDKEQLREFGYTE